MTDYVVRYQGSEKQFKVTAESPRLAYKIFIERIEIVKKDPVEVWNGTNWVKFEGHKARSQTESYTAAGRSLTETTGSATIENSSANILDPKLSGLFKHRQKLRSFSAYPFLRIVNIINSILIALGFLFWGVESGDGGAGFAFLIVGIILAILNYSVVSVFYDVADACINTSMNSEKKGGS